MQVIITKNTKTPIPNKKLEKFKKTTKDDMPEFLKDCKAFSPVSISNRKVGAPPYLERVLGWKIKNTK